LLWRDDRGCGHVFGLLMRVMTPVGPDDIDSRRKGQGAPPGAASARFPISICSPATDSFRAIIARWKCESPRLSRPRQTALSRRCRGASSSIPARSRRRAGTANSSTTAVQSQIAIKSSDPRRLRERRGASRRLPGYQPCPVPISDASRQEAQAKGRSRSPAVAL
jgi:hypothetical protein